MTSRPRWPAATSTVLWLSFATARAVLEAIAAHGLQPVLVVDDADHFTRRDPRAQHAVRVGAFFGPVLAEASKLPCGMVVAVHDGYESMTAFRKARADFGVLQRTIAVPEIVSGQLTRILERRIHATIGAGVEQIITAEAIDALAEINRAPPSATCAPSSPSRIRR